MVRADDVQRGRESYGRGAWTNAFESLTRADRSGKLTAEDLELLARSAYMLGRDLEYVDGLERAHQAHLAAHEVLPAVRSAFWIGHNLIFRGERAPALGWFARAHRLLEREGRDCVERGYLLIPDLVQHVISGELEAAEATAAETVAIGERFGDRDLVAIGLMEQGHALVRQGRAKEGLGLLDETMVAVTTGELSPIVAGIVYCNTIAFCRDAYELRRAREWTAALTRWCEQQPDMVAHRGLCLVHRAEIMTFGGAWQDALDEAIRVGERFTEGVLNQRALGHAAYRQGEVHRLRGEFEAAEAAYSEASLIGREPQPGLALLRLAQGNGPAAAAAIRRTLGEAGLPLKRAALLPAFVEIMLAVDGVTQAREACDELGEIAARQDSDVLAAMSLQARGAVALAESDAETALAALRRASLAWQELEAPYEAARTRELAGLACRVLADEDAAALELEAAREILARLGAAADIARIDSAGSDASMDGDHGLTARELEVLRLVAAGKSNHAIAVDLHLSDHTIRRHLQNIFRKLNVSSRAAATAFAFRNRLI